VVWIVLRVGAVVARFEYKCATIEAMRYVSIRELRNRPGRVWSVLSKEDVVLTASGKPMGILLGVDEARLDETVDAIRRDVGGFADAAESGGDGQGQHVHGRDQPRDHGCPPPPASGLRIVLDTNVLVAGLLNPEGNPGRVVDLFLAGELTLLVDDRILAEYRAVLARPKFLFGAEEISTLVDAIESEGSRIAARPLNVELADAGDAPFLEVAVAGDADSLVTGNARHFRAERHRTRIESPTEFIQRWKREREGG
jgi:putative PIN family toxin of toxin-antitoxin system